MKVLLRFADERARNIRYYLRRRYGSKAELPKLIRIAVANAVSQETTEGMLYTTFRRLKEEGACQPDYDNYAALKGGDIVYGMDEPLPLDDIVEKMGIEDGLWALQALTEPIPPWVYLYLAKVAERTLPIWEKRHPDDQCPRQAIEGIGDFVAGRITRKQLKRLALAASAVADIAYADADADYTADIYTDAYAAALAAYACAYATCAAADADATYAAAHTAYASAVATYAGADAERQWQTAQFLLELRKGG